MYALKQGNEDKCRKFASMREKYISLQAHQEANRTVEAADLRGHTHRAKLMMAPSEAQEFLEKPSRSFFEQYPA